MEPINILYLHGANAHPDNFNYYKLLLPEHNSIAPTYNMDDNPFDVVDFVTRKVNREFGNKPIVVIGHSFGGLIGAWYSSVNSSRVTSLITIASPWEGTPAARIFGYFFRNAEVFKHTRPGAQVLHLLQDKVYKGPHHNIVCTGGGNPVAGMGSQANDGMISVASQSATPQKFTMTKNHYIETGHSGVLLNNTATDLLNKFIFGEGGGPEHTTK